MTDEPRRGNAIYTALLAWAIQNRIDLDRAHCVYPDSDYPEVVFFHHALTPEQFSRLDEAVGGKWIASVCGKTGWLTGSAHYWLRSTLKVVVGDAFKMSPTGIEATPWDDGSTVVSLTGRDFATELAGTTNE